MSKYYILKQNKTVEYYYININYKSKNRGINT